MLKDNNINVSKMTEDALAMSCFEFLDYGYVRPALLSCVHPLHFYAWNTNSHTGRVQAQKAATDPRGLSCLMYIGQA